MSTGKVQISQQTTGNPEVLRDLQEAVAKTARDIQRKRALSQFHSVITEVDSIDQRRRTTIRDSDKASKELPDYIAPEIPRTFHVEMPDENATTDEVSLFTNRLRSKVSRYDDKVANFNSDVITARKIAEEQLHKREEMASAYITIQGLKQNSQVLVKAIEDLNESVNCQSPGKLINSTNPDDLEQIQASLSDWQTYCNELTQHLNSAKCRNETAKRLSASSGTLINTESANEAWSQFHKEGTLKQRDALITARDLAINASSVSIPDARLSLINDVIESAPFALEASQITRMISRMSAELKNQHKASGMLKDVPALIETTQTSVRDSWNAHLSNLQRVSQGLDAYSPSLERAHDAIHSAAIRHLKFEEMKAQLIAQHGESFTFYHADTQLIALHNTTDVGYDIKTVINDERGIVASVWEMFCYGEDLSQDDYSKVCGDYQNGTQDSPMESGEGEQGNANTVRKKTMPRAMQQVLY